MELDYEISKYVVERFSTENDLISQEVFYVEEDAYFRCRELLALGDCFVRMFKLSRAILS